ncbi:MAG TPA: SH3 domain-containing protein [Hyphomonadaceae bacterium]|nr:SH3 domain-containing protein [Hyphomonadaceae bacterium]
MSGKRTSFVTFLLVAQICGAALSAPASHAQSVQSPAATLAPGSFKAYAAEGVASRVSDFSGLAVPRYSSLRYDKVNGRAGPSLDYPVTWTYGRQGLPVVIVRESQEWRKIRDPQGDEVWVHRRMLAAERTAITTAAGAIKHEADSRSQPVARFNIGAVLKLEACTPAWCRVEAEGRKGFVLKSLLWGADALPPAPK